MITGQPSDAADNDTGEGQHDRADYMLRRPSSIGVVSTVLVVLQVPACKDGSDCRVQTREYCEAQEVLVVSFAHTCADPGTMVVVHFDASFAITAVEGSRRPVDVTRSADFDVNF